MHKDFPLIQTYWQHLVEAEGLAGVNSVPLVRNTVGMARRLYNTDLSPLTNIKYPF